MKARVHAVSIDTVRRDLLRGEGGALEDLGGWCVYVSPAGSRHYVYDENASMVRYRAMACYSTCTSPSESRPQGATPH